jgi:glycosyltransferase involved in cell wall biosynthesis
MFASVEYLLAGLAVVTTPAQGGRHIYFEDAYCLTVPPDARAVAEAVAALASRAIPAAHIRAKTLQKMTAQRMRFLDLLDRIIEDSGGRGGFDGIWLFDRRVMMRWQPAGNAIAKAAGRVVDAYTPRRLRYWTEAFRARFRRWGRGGRP